MLVLGLLSPVGTGCKSKVGLGCRCRRPAKVACGAVADPDPSSPILNYTRGDWSLLVRSSAKRTRRSAEEEREREIFGRHRARLNRQTAALVKEQGEQ
jgi:hypothetical protein